jgi:DnaJ like chaperone protein
MSWFGKIVGGTLGLFVGGPIGAIGGAALGHYVFDRGGDQAGGGFAGEMPLSHEQREFAINVFNEAKRSPYSIEDFARQFQQITAGRPEIHTQMVDMLYQLAAVDQHLHEQEEAAIRSVSRILGLNDRQVDGIKAKYFDAAGSHYEVLGIPASSSDDEVRKAYRELARKYHPDTVVSKGLPEEFVDFAHTRFKEIQAAYEAVKRERNMS